MSLDQVLFGLVVLAIILLIIAIVIGLRVLSNIQASREETERLRAESIAGHQLATVVGEQVADAVERVVHYYGIDRQLGSPPLRIGLTATPHVGQPGYLDHMQYWRDGDVGSENGGGVLRTPPPGHDPYNGHSGELPALDGQFSPEQVIDHPGARAQLAERAGRPAAEAPHALQGYEEVQAGSPQYRPLSEPPDTASSDFYWLAGIRRPGDTDVIDAVREPGTPPEFRDSEFQRRPDETEEAYRDRIAGLTQDYEAWLAAQRLDVTGQIPAITSVPHHSSYEPAGVQGAGAPVS